jgi:hypothetical protein
MGNNTIENTIKDNFTQIGNEIITDTTISNGALRVYLYLLSKPTGWNVFNKDVQSQLGIKQSQTLSRYWKELIDAGYIKRKMAQSEDEQKTGSFIYLILWKNHNMEKPIYGKTHKHNNTKPLSNTQYKRDPTKSLNSSSLSLSSSKDTKTHKPREVWDKLLLDYDNEFKDKEVKEVAASFIKYRDEMFNSTKDKKYSIKTTRSVVGFLKVMSQVDDYKRAFQVMEDNEWATYKTEWEHKGWKN